MAHPALYPKLLQPGLGCPSSSCPSLYNLAIFSYLVLFIFFCTSVPSWPLSLPSLLSLYGLSHGSVHSGLSQMSPLLAMLFLISTINFLPHHTWKQSCPSPTPPPTSFLFHSQRNFSSEDLGVGIALVTQFEFLVETDSALVSRFHPPLPKFRSGPYCPLKY